MKAKELCPICGGELEETEVKEDIWVGEELLVIENVHARICEKCGEKIVSYDEMRRIEGIIREFERGKMELKRITAYVASIWIFLRPSKRSRFACLKSKRTSEIRED